MKNLTKEKKKTNITAKEWLNAKKILVTLQKITKGGYVGFNIYLLTPEGEILRVCGGPNWSEKGGYYYLTGWGFNRAFNVVHALSIHLLGVDLDLIYSKIYKKIEYLYS